MSYHRPYQKPGSEQTYRGPGAEMLASDAATEFRSFTLLYEQYADRIYRCLLTGTADIAQADDLMDRLVSSLPRELDRFATGDRTFNGWLFSLAVKRLQAAQSPFSRVIRQFPDVLGRFGSESSRAHTSSDSSLQSFLESLKQVPAFEREVIAVFVAADLPSKPASEALGIPATLLPSNADRAFKSLAAALGEQRPMDAAERFHREISNVKLSAEQRERHLAHVHRLFTGEPEPQESRGGIGREVGAIVGLVLFAIVTLVAWEIITAEGEPEEEEPTIASQPDVRETPTPTVEIETDDPDSEADAIAANGVCSTSDSKAIVRGFAEAFNSGDVETLDSMLPDDSFQADSIDLGGLWIDAGDVQQLQLYDVTLNDRDEILAYLEDRYAAGERWEIGRIIPDENHREFYEAMTADTFQNWARQNPGMAVMFLPDVVRVSSTTGPSTGYGRIIVDCEHGQVLSWQLSSGQLTDIEPVPLDDFLFAAEPLTAGEIRSITARVSTTARSDGGNLLSWEIEWWNALDEAGTELEFVEVRTTQGDVVIEYVNDGDRWRLVQRDWRLYGRSSDTVPLPEEIALVRPWLNGTLELVWSERGDLDDETTVMLDHDLTDASATGRLQRFEIDIVDGDVVSSRFRIGSQGGHVFRPQLRFLEVTRSNAVDGEQFVIEAEPEFPQLVIGAPRYPVPLDETDDLEYISLTVGDEGAREVHVLRWEGSPVQLEVTPSRGGLDASVLPTEFSSSWEHDRHRYTSGTFIWAKQPDYSMVTDAIWDDGRYRFHLQLDLDAIDDDVEWALSDIVRLIEILSGAGVDAD